MSARTYLSIGDVLSLLRQEFPDVTISKIRFLESQGLVNPERTPSGYRKFYEHDVERLRWVLRQQREHFLPLKVIKGRLEHQGDDDHFSAEFDVPIDGDFEEGGAGADERPADLVDARDADADAAEAGAGAMAGSVRDAGAVRPVPALVGSGAAEVAGAGRAGERSGPTLPGFESHPSGAAVPASARVRPAETLSATAPARPAQQAKADRPEKAERPARSAGSARAAARGAAAPAAGAADGATRTGARDRPPRGGGRAAASEARGATGAGAPRATGARSPRAKPDDEAAVAPVIALSGTSMTLEELAAASGSSVEATAELESYGLLSGRVVGGVAYYDEDALTVARLAAGFAEFGVEARHLRLHKHAAEREAGFIEQIVLPLLRQRNPESRQRAQDMTAELGRLGQAMRAVLLRAALRDVLGG